MTIWKLDVDRVRLVGARVGGLEPVELRALIARAVERAFETTPLPNGRAMKASVRVPVSASLEGGAIANAVASGVSQAVGGRTRG